MLGLGATVTCAVALIQGNGQLAARYVVILGILGTLFLFGAVVVFRWYRAPVPIGTPLRTVIMFTVCTIPMGLLCWYVWPEPQKPLVVQHDQIQQHENLATNDNASITRNNSAPITSPKLHPRQSRGARDGVQDHGTQAHISTDIPLEVVIVAPEDPAIVVANNTDNIAEGITWELVMFRTTDQAFFSYATQNIGYLKAHSRSPHYVMNLNNLPRSNQTGLVSNGESYVGSIAIDCPTCRGTTVIVNFIWGVSGWFYEAPDGNGGLFLPKGMSKEAIVTYIEFISSSITRDRRTEIK